MATDFPPPQFTVGQEIATFLVSCGILHKAWEESLRASKAECFTLNEYENVAYVTFPSFQGLEDFIVNGSECGEGNIQTDHNVFSGYLKGNNDELALIHQGALKLFLHIMEETEFQEKIYTDSEQKKLKPIIFVGHSLGGAVATLATLWVLGKRLRQSSPFCITFGCPLVGDVRLVEAVGRENWGGQFCHVVSQYDIVPRMLLAPFESIAQPFTTVFPYWQGINMPDSITQDACKTLLNHVHDSPNTNSPYKPFGTYMFCSSNGATFIENSETVLEMLHLTMQSQETSFGEIVQACFLEHTRYGSVLEEVMQISIRGRRIVNPNSEYSDEMGISLQLEATGVGAQQENARLALRRAGKIENGRIANVDKLAIDLGQKQCNMTELEWYKERCEEENGIAYYNSFKNQNDKKDIHANNCRLKLKGFWDEIIEMWEKRELPDDFESQNKWINAGTAYRKLVEPLDIAYYYRMCKGNSNYLSDGRPKRHRVLQKWMEEKEKNRSKKSRTKPASLTEDSCFWAYVEEALKDLENLKNGQHQSLESLEGFEDKVTRMINDHSISLDVFREESSFMTWWKDWKECKKNQFPERRFPLYEIMESESWRG